MALVADQAATPLTATVGLRLRFISFNPHLRRWLPPLSAPAKTTLAQSCRLLRSPPRRWLRRRLPHLPQHKRQRLHRRPHQQRLQRHLRPLRHHLKLRRPSPQPPRLRLPLQRVPLLPHRKSPEPTLRRRLTTRTGSRLNFSLPMTPATSPKKKTLG